MLIGFRICLFVLESPTESWPACVPLFLSHSQITFSHFWNLFSPTFSPLPKLSNIPTVVLLSLESSCSCKISYEQVLKLWFSPVCVYFKAAPVDKNPGAYHYYPSHWNALGFIFICTPLSLKKMSGSTRDFINSWAVMLQRKVKKTMVRCDFLEQSSSFEEEGQWGRQAHRHAQRASGIVLSPCVLSPGQHHQGLTSQAPWHGKGEVRR